MKRTRRAVIVIPTFNEGDTIIKVLEGLLEDAAAKHIWVVDGGSTDDTREKVTAYLPVSPRLRLIDSPKRTQAHAVNLAAKLAKEQGADTLIRVDAHATYPKNFVSGLLLHMQQSEAASVVVPLIARTPETGGVWRLAGADLQNSWLGHGGAAHRRPSKSGWVTHGHHAAFDLDVFLSLDGYDPSFHACEDVDFDMRLIQAGHKIWCAGTLSVAYLPRSSPHAYMKQMLRNGKGRGGFARKHGAYLQLRQVFPLLAMLTCAISIAGAILLGPGYGVVGVAYVALVICLAILARRKMGFLHTCRIASLALIAHLSYGAGLVFSFFQPDRQSRRLPD